MVKRRLRVAGLSARLSPHSFGVTTITDSLEQGAPLEDVQCLAGTRTRGQRGSTIGGREDHPQYRGADFDLKHATSSSRPRAERRRAELVPVCGVESESRRFAIVGLAAPIVRGTAGNRSARILGIPPFRKRNMACASLYFCDWIEVTLSVLLGSRHVSSDPASSA
jgi:hypothetical protein